MSEDTSDGFAANLPVGGRSAERAKTMLRELGLSTKDAHKVAWTFDALQREARTAEREECAKVCDEVARWAGHPRNDDDRRDRVTAVVCAERIRARR